MFDKGGQKSVIFVLGMKSLTRYRILAFAIDYGIIVAYGAILFLIATRFVLPTDIQPGEIDPFNGQVIGFLTLTLPVFLYFYFCESGRKSATIGKRLFGLKVVATKDDKSKSILIRNLLKLLPWELAHMGVHWAVYYDAQQIKTPLWTWVLLIVPQLVVVIYFVSIIASRGKSSIYDRAAKTEVMALRDL